MAFIELAIDAVSDVFTNAVLAMLTLLLGLILGKLIGKILLLILHEFDTDNFLRETIGLELPVEQMVGSMTAYAIYVLFAIFALNILGIAPQVVSVLAGIASIIVLVYMVLGLRDFVPNAFAGITLYRRAQVRKGEKITAQEITGIVRHQTITETRIVTEDGDVISIPNTLLVRHPVIIHKK